MLVLSFFHFVQVARLIHRVAMLHLISFSGRRYESQDIKKKEVNKSFDLFHMK